MTPIIRHLGMQPYHDTWQAMQLFTQKRHADTSDELWTVEHPPIFTQGLAGKAEHVLNPGNIPVIATDRGGQVTYHGPGQLIIYVLLDLKRNKQGIRQLVSILEQAVITVLAHYHIKAHALCQQRGVYVDNSKICSIGLRVRKHCTYHGLALNVNMDLTPFSQINPCGYPGLNMTHIAHWIPNIKMSTVCDQLTLHLSQQFTTNSQA